MRALSPTTRTFLDVVAALLASYALLLAFGLGTQMTSPIYAADEWVTFDNIRKFGALAGTVCNHYGHALVLPNLHFIANYLWLDANSTARALVVMATYLASTIGIAYIVLRGRSVGRTQSIAIYLVLACFGIWGGLGHKLWWSFGLTDGLAFFGAVITAFGLIRLLEHSEKGAWGGLALMIFGAIIGTFSFGTGLVIWPAFAIVMFARQVPLRYVALFLAAGVVAVSVAMFGLQSCLGGARGSVLDLSALNPILTITNWLATLGYLPALAFAKFLGVKYHWVWSTIGFFLILTVCILGFRLAFRNERDPSIAALVSLAAVPIGAALLLALARTPADGMIAPYYPRYAALVMPLYLSLTAVGLRYILTLNRDVARVLPILLAIVFIFSNLAWMRKFDASFKRSTIGALASVIDLKGNSDAFRSLNTMQFPRVRTGVEYLIKERKGFYGLAVAQVPLGAPKIEPSSPGFRCTGTLDTWIAFSKAPFQSFIGQVTAEQGVNIDHLEGYSNNRLVGLAMKSGYARVPNSAVWQGRLLELSGFAIAYGLGSGYVGFAEVDFPDGNAAAPVDWDCVSVDGRRAPLVPPSP